MGVSHSSSRSQKDQGSASKSNPHEENQTREIKEKPKQKPKRKERHEWLSYIKGPKEGKPVAQITRPRESESEGRLPDEQYQQNGGEEDHQKYVSRYNEHPSSRLSLLQANRDEEEHGEGTRGEERDRQLNEEDIHWSSNNEHPHEETVTEADEQEDEKRQEGEVSQEEGNNDKKPLSLVASNKSTDLDSTQELELLPNSLSLSQEALDVIVLHAYKCLQIIKPWRQASSDHPTLSKVIQDICDLGIIYFDAIDNSIVTAQEGYGISGDATHLCDMLLDPGTDQEDLRQYIVDMKDKANLALEKCVLALNKFREVRKNLINIIKRVPDEVYKDDNSKLFTRAPLFEDEKGHEPGLADAMKRLNLTIIDLGALTEGVNKFVKWWVEMEIYIKDVETKGSGLRPGRDRARVKQVRKIWSDIKRDYLEYKTKIIRLQDHYPSRV